MDKQASALTDYLSTIGYQALGSMPSGNQNGGFNQTGQALSGVSGIGGLMGLGSEAATEADEQEWDDTPAQAALPGVGNYRVQRRMKRQLLNDEGKNPHYWSQTFSPAVHVLLAATAGGVLGYRNRDKLLSNTFLSDADDMAKKIFGTHTGVVAGVGAVGATGLLAGLLALAHKTRTKKEQKDYANTSTAAEWLVPGVAQYNKWKTLGRSIKDSDERAEKKRKKKESEDKA